MIKAQSIDKSINKGVDSLVKNQLKDGSFLSLSSFNPKGFSKVRKYHSTFPASLILSSLNTLKETPRTQEIKRKTADFLLSQKSEHWSFNYWKRDSEESKIMPYPDDLDDTACALAALFKYSPKIIDGAAMGKFIMTLTALEEKEGGPYRTWLVRPDAEEVWQDVDLAVNSNIAYFLSLQDVSLDNFNTLIERAIDDRNYSSPYYPSEYPIIYFISRFYRGDKIQKIIDFLLSKQDGDGKWDNPLNTALVISAFFNFGFGPDKLEKSISYLIKKGQPGFWMPYVFCIDPAIKGRKYYAGSSALTTAFCLEALEKYLNSSQDKKIIRKTVPVKTEEIKEQTKIYNSISQEAIKRCSELNQDLKKQVLNQLARTLKKNKDKQIVLLPYFFKTALVKNGENISGQKLKLLGLANLYGWIAYTIYDDFLDDEGEPKLLSVANLMLRDLTTIFNNVLPPESGFHTFFHQIMDALDAANTWEVNNCRIDIRNNQLKIPNTLPNYGNFTKIAERSLGHMLGPTAILFSLGYTEKSSEIKNLTSFFKHYLTARQLNDDAHDWEEDIKKGHINSVGSAVLRKWREMTPFKKQKEINILKIMPDLQKISWQEVMPGICQNVLKQTELAKKSLLKIPPISNPSIMVDLLVPVRRSAEKALTEREEAIKFLKAYNV
ncbi:MAG: hypothetical protein KJI71_01755 [Patescibacteria group bacterium]|nr:hypothetical protein [Patescibacteria group bacterium]